MLSRVAGCSSAKALLPAVSSLNVHSHRTFATDPNRPFTQQFKSLWSKEHDHEWHKDRPLTTLDAKSADYNAIAQDLDQECLVVLPQQQGAFKLPMVYPTMGQPTIDIRQLHPKTQLTTYDPGFMSTSSCHSEITFMDGPKGVLLHRGYAIDDLCDNSSYEELIYLLLYGELPSKDSYDEHLYVLNCHTMVHEKIIQFFKGFHHTAHPMAMMCAAVGGLAAYYHDSMDINDPLSRLKASYRIIAKMPTLAAMAYKMSIGQPMVHPLNSHTLPENFMRMMFSVPAEPYEIHPVVASALDKFLMLHCDHEQNASTSTVRIAGSSQANPFACIASGITALWGPAHGGANEAVLDMLTEIGSKENIPKFVEKAKDKKDPFRLMGFGHRVYKSYDPRAKVMKKMCHELLDALDIRDEPLLEIAMELEHVATTDDYFVSRGLYPNVDFYSGIVLKAMRFPKNMYTVLFAVGRSVGWVSQWKEMMSDPKQKIGRPRQLFVGDLPKQYISLDNRGDHADNPHVGQLGCR